MLHAAAAVLLDRTKQAPKTHAALIGQFAQLVQGDEQGRRFGRAFNLADKLRLVADYDDQRRSEGADCQGSGRASCNSH